jgi:hypothetical protein
MFRSLARGTKVNYVNVRAPLRCRQTLSLPGEVVGHGGAPLVPRQRCHDASSHRHTQQLRARLEGEEGGPPRRCRRELAKSAPVGA